MHTKPNSDMQALPETWQLKQLIEPRILLQYHTVHVYRR